MADIKTKFIFTKNGAVSAVVFPGEPVNNTYGEAAGEVPFETEVGVGDAWPLADTSAPKGKAKKAADPAPDAPAA
jgi:hypothetical protein